MGNNYGGDFTSMTQGRYGFGDLGQYMDSDDEFGFGQGGLSSDAPGLDGFSDRFVPVMDQSGDQQGGFALILYGTYESIEEFLSRRQTPVVNMVEQKNLNINYTPGQEESMHMMEHQNTPGGMMMGDDMHGLGVSSKVAEPLVAQTMPGMPAGYASQGSTSGGCPPGFMCS
ncbi:hypothetical protein DFH28DRAFT_984270 [Melampsora americana]|nr:hypothetical protein DFH28DRAFT_984270 [Melampsora americana]